MNVILRCGNYVLIDRNDLYIVACGYNEETKNWDYGIYFNHWDENELVKLRSLSKAIECFRTKVDEEYISRSRLEEIATDSLHNLAECDSGTAMEFFENELELTDFERKYFGINVESKEE